MDEIQVTDHSAGMSARQFNRICFGAALVWIFGALFVSMRVSPVERSGQEFHDFSQFYMGGAVARHGAWEAMYPVPQVGSLNNAGGGTPDSAMRPGYAALADAAGVPADNTRFIQPPPFSLMLAPFGALDYRNAKRAWNLVMALCAWGVAVMAGLSYENALGQKSRGAGWVTLGVAVCPLTLETVRIMNVSPFLALMIGFSIFGLLGRGERGALALVFGAVAKYATAALLPLYVAMRKWRALGVMAIAGALIVIGSMAIMGVGPFRVFVREMLPTFGRPHTFPWNRSFYALMMYMQNGLTDGELRPLTGMWAGSARALQWITFIGITGVLLTRKAEAWRRPGMVFAGAATLLAWFMAFSPILWDHYMFYLVPLWGWLVWEARGSMIKTVLVAAILLFQCIPAFVLDSARGQRLHLRGPYEVIPLLIVVVVGGLGVARLRDDRMTR